MRVAVFFCLFLLLPVLVLAAGASQSELAPAMDLEFSGYRFGQSPSANMTCFSGYCKSQAPGGDGRITFPFSVYETPGAVSTLAGLVVVKPRYTFWEDRLYRVSFQVDCTPLEPAACLDDIVATLHREYTLFPLAASDTQQFIEERHILLREFRTESGALVNIRSTTLKDQPVMTVVDIIDQTMAGLVISTVTATHRPQAGIAEAPNGQ